MELIGHRSKTDYIQVWSHVKKVASSKVCSKKHCIVSEIKKPLVFAKKRIPRIRRKKIRCQEAQKLQKTLPQKREKSNH